MIHVSISIYLDIYTVYHGFFTCTKVLSVVRESLCSFIFLLNKTYLHLSIPIPLIYFDFHPMPIYVITILAIKNGPHLRVISRWLTYWHQFCSVEFLLSWSVFSTLWCCKLQEWETPHSGRSYITSSILKLWKNFWNTISRNS